MKNNCKRYGQAITDYVLGEEIDCPKEELMSHLKACAKCRAELTNWQDFQNALRVKEHHSRPEVKEKWDRFIRELVSPSQPAESGRAPAEHRGILNIEEKVGAPAGILYQALARNGEVKIEHLPQITELPPPKAYSAFGWLACQKKVVMRQDDKGTYVALTPLERERSQAQI